MQRDGLWQHPDFMRLWAAQTVSVFGSLITHTAVPFTAVIALDASPAQVAVLAAARIVPSLLFGFVAGVWIDRLRRRPLMIWCDWLRAALLLTIPAAWAFDVLRIEQLYSVMFLTGTLTLIFDVAYRSYLPTLVEREELLEGNSKLTATESVAEFSAFGAAGWLVQLLSGPLAVLIDAATFVFSAIFVRSIKAPEPPPAGVEERQSMVHEASAGLRTVLGHPVLRSIAGATALAYLGFGFIGATVLIFCVRTLGFEPGVLGMIFGIGGLSSLCGALLARRAGRRFGLGWSMVLGMAMMGAFQMLLPMASGATVFSAALLIAPQMFGDGSFTVYSVNEVSLRQAVAPERMRGRVNAFMHLTENSALLAGTLIGGVVGEAASVRTSLVVGASLILCSAAWQLATGITGVRATPARLDEAPATV